MMDFLVLAGAGDGQGISSETWVIRWQEKVLEKLGRETRLVLSFPLL
jgi:hypothetical protein